MSNPKTNDRDIADFGAVEQELEREWGVMDTSDDGDPDDDGSDDVAGF